MRIPRDRKERSIQSSSTATGVASRTSTTRSYRCTRGMSVRIQGHPAELYYRIDATRFKIRDEGLVRNKGVVKRFMPA